MGLSITSSDNPNATELKGVFIQQSKIVGVSDLSGKAIFDRNYDLALELELTTGFDWNKKMTIKGNFRYSETDPGKVEDWGGAFVIRELFRSLKFFDNLSSQEVKEKMELFQKKQIPADFISRLYNQNVYVISYITGWNEVKGKAKYCTWNQVGLDREKFLSDFKESLMKGYPRNYDPEALGNSSTDFNFGMNEKQTSTGKHADTESDFVF